MELEDQPPAEEELEPVDVPEEDETEDSEPSPYAIVTGKR